MGYKLDDVLSGGIGGQSSKSQSEEVRLPCPLGNDCKHKNSAECDEYRQTLLYKKHAETCPDGENCQHFAPTKGMPETALWRGESPAQFLKRTRGI